MSSKRRVRPYSQFSYYPDGNRSVEVNPDPPSPEEARPFHVAISDPSYIPVSILVFARDKKHALSRVRQALVECRDKQYVPEYGLSDLHRERAQKFLDAIDTGSMLVEVNPLDVALICAKVNWASNGGLL